MLSIWTIDYNFLGIHALYYQCAKASGTRYQIFDFIFWNLMSKVKFPPSGAHHVRLPLVFYIVLANMFDGHLAGGQYRHRVFACYDHVLICSYYLIYNFCYVVTTVFILLLFTFVSLSFLFVCLHNPVFPFFPDY